MLYACIATFLDYNFLIIGGVAQSQSAVVSKQSARLVRK